MQTREPPAPDRPAAAAPAAKMRLGDALVARGVITETQLALALAEQKRTGEPVGQALKRLGFIKEEDLIEQLAADLGVPFVRLAGQRIDFELRRGLNREFLLKNLVLPLAEERGMVTVAMARPSDVTSLDTLQKSLKRALRVVAAPESDIRAAILEARDAETAAPHATTGEQDATTRTEAILARALREGATDIHVEPEERVVRIRFRVDGVLRNADSVAPEDGAGLTARIKVLAGLDIAEHRRPQDGRFRHRDAGRDVDLRVSSIPTRHGENLVLRILDRSGLATRLDRLGFAPPLLEKLKTIGGLAYGLFLVTGPTGSGKTTTLYSLLASVDALTRKVASIEDPIEAELPLIRQSQVDRSIDFDFAAGLRALLRQDPDVILVGEIRDSETASIAVRASLTGHLVLATLHTNDALGAPSRLIDMGVEPFLLSSTLAGVLAQRLVRTVCAQCVAEAEPGPADRLLFQGRLPERLARGAGCPRCANTGYRGRTGIHELILPNAEFKKALLAGCDAMELRRAAAAAGFAPMAEDGARKVRAGITTAEEVLRVARMAE